MFYTGRRITQWVRFVRQLRLARITPEELRSKIERGEDLLILDLQGQAGDAGGLIAIPGAIRIDPRRLSRYHSGSTPASSVCARELTNLRQVRHVFATYI